MPADRPSHVTIRPSVLYVGTPVMLIATANADGTANLAPASSYWALEQTIVLGLEDGGRTIANLLERPELTVNFPQPELWRAVEAIADTTGMDPVPHAKRPRYRFVADKFAHAGLTPAASETVAPPRVEECVLQFEAVVRRITPGVGGYSIVEADVHRVHASTEIVEPGSDHIDPAAWRPIVYNFRRYHAIGDEHGRRPAG